MLPELPDLPPAPSSPARHAMPTLPSVLPEAVAVINRLSRTRPALRLTVLGRPATVRLSLLGAPDPTVMSVAIRIGESTGRISLPQHLVERVEAQLVIGATLLAEEPAQRAILVEFALLSLLGPIEQRLGQPIRVLPEDPAGLGVLPLALTVTLGFEDGTKTACRLELPVDLAARLAIELDRLAPPASLDAAAIPVELVLSAGWQDLSLSELGSLSPGDVVMLEGTTTEAVVGGRLRGQVDDADARFRLRTALQAVSPPLQKDRDMSDKDDESGIGALPVRLVMEFGRVEMTIGELRALAPGSLLPLSRPVGDAVDIVAHGRRIGRGSLVTIGEGLGVRITRLADDAGAAQDE